MSWLSKLFGKPDPNNNELQTMKLDLIEKEKRIKQLESDLERERLTNRNQVQAAVTSQMDKLYQDLAAPLAQLNTQIYMVDNNQPLTARDLSVVAKRITRICQDNGLTYFGNIGEKTMYDSEKHAYLGSQTQTGETPQIIIRFCGLSYQGKIIQKAGVEAA